MARTFAEAPEQRFLQGSHFFSLLHKSSLDLRVRMAERSDASYFMHTGRYGRSGVAAVSKRPSLSVSSGMSAVEYGGRGASVCVLVRHASSCFCSTIWSVPAR